MVELFWLLVGVIGYTYLGYPLLLLVAGSLLDRRVRMADARPSVSVVIAAFNEAGGIAARLRNLLESDYPPDRLEIVVASDGSTDGTVRAAAAVGDPRVRVLDLPRQGKAAALAAGAQQARGEILLFTDANTVFRRDALRRLVSNFADPDVGGVAGHTTYCVGDETDCAGRGEDLYWRYDTWLKRLETKTGSVVSAHGGMYAVRRELFRPVEDAAVTDDFAISTAVVDAGRRLVFEPTALGYEEPMASADSEFHRRVRLMTRGVRGIVLRRRLLNPLRHGFYSVALLSRKVLRRLLPLAFPLLFLASVLLAESSVFFAAIAAAQLSVTILAVLGWAARGSRLGRSFVLYAPFFFFMANLASVMAIWNVARGRRVERWTPQRHDAPAVAHDHGRAALEPVADA